MWRIEGWWGSGGMGWRFGVDAWLVELERGVLWSVVLDVAIQGS